MISANGFLLFAENLSEATLGGLKSTSSKTYD